MSEEEWIGPLNSYQSHDEWRSSPYSAIKYPYNDRQEEINQRITSIEGRIIGLAEQLNQMMSKLFNRLEELDARFTDLTKDQPTPAFRCPECEEVKPAEAFAGDYICKACRG